jgi:hypothetical protein
MSSSSSSSTSFLGAGLADAGLAATGVFPAGPYADAAFLVPGNFLDSAAVYEAM